MYWSYYWYIFPIIHHIKKYSKYTKAELVVSDFKNKLWYPMQVKKNI